MSPYHKKQKEKQRKNLFRKWHRRIGFSAAAFLINIAVTGVLLNHSDDLKLQDKYVESSWLVNWYGIESPEKTKCYSVGSENKTFCQLGEKLFLNSSLLHANSNELIGALQLQEFIFLATVDQIFIYTQTMDLVEIIDENTGLPKPISTISIFRENTGLTSTFNKLSIVVESHDTFWTMNVENLEWQELDSYSPETIDPVEISTDAEEAIKKVYLEQELSYLKVIQDLHSGRVLSVPGKLMTDIVAVIIIILAFSGFFAWQKRNKTTKN